MKETFNFKVFTHLTRMNKVATHCDLTLIGFLSECEFEPVVTVGDGEDDVGDERLIQIFLEIQDRFFYPSDLVGFVGENSDENNQIWNDFSNFL
jgi:hypothetical protein